MLKILSRVSALVLIASCALSAGSYNKQAEKDRVALVKYFETKFNGMKNKNKYFPYSTQDELKNNFPNKIKHKEFALGSYSFNTGGKSQYDDIKELPPYEELIEEGEKLYAKKFKNGKSFKNCFPKTTIAGDYPKFDNNKNKIITLTSAINTCLVKNGQKKWNPKKGKITKLEAFFAYKSTEANKKVNIKINSKAAKAAYERGKKEYYTQRGYLSLSCATCHVQGAGQRVRNEYMSPLLGHTTHFPVFRLKWGSKSKNGNGLGTLERRMAGCNKDQGENPHKPNSKWMKELLYFMAYMSNGMKIDGPDIRK